ncbi:hypothetical protein KO465_09045 [Candidatus Micrarchaeota archaeon]|jgi:hypothetical protein|nr:hypothetical protein [Candidatus Micrarchaeota archaeon]
MPDEPQGQEQMEDQDQSPMPSDEDQTEGDLPDETTERTREQFEKLKESNQKLKEELERAKTQPQPSVLDSLRPPPQLPQFSANQFSHLDQQQVDQVSEQLINKGEDGFDYVNTNALKSALKEANDRARRAEESARMAAERFNRFEETAQIREAYSKFPQLDPNSDKFDSTFYNNVRDKLIAQAFRGEKDLVKAATEVGSLYSPKEPIKEQKEEEVKQPQEADTQSQTKKEQIMATGNSAGRYTGADFDALKAGTMRGKKGALAERLRRSGY